MEYKVYLIHRMRSVQFTEADSEGEALEFAYEQSFDCQGGWEEIDTECVSVTKMTDKERKNNGL